MKLKTRPKLSAMTTADSFKQVSVLVVSLAVLVAAIFAWNDTSLRPAFMSIVALFIPFLQASIGKT